MLHCNVQLIPAQPIDQLSIGFGDLTPAVDYAAPNSFNGKVITHQVTVSDPNASVQVETSDTFTDAGQKGFGNVDSPSTVDPRYRFSR